LGKERKSLAQRQSKRMGPYRVDCNCKFNFFSEARTAVSHCKDCNTAHFVYYCSPYSDDKIVYDKSKGN
jgi:hypothetical protein